MGYFDKIAGVGALLLGLLALGGMISTDAYSTGARVDASGYDALNHLIVNDGNPLCMNDADRVLRGVQHSKGLAQ